MKALELKLSLIQMISNIEDNNLLKKISDTINQLKKEDKDEPWNAFTDKQKAAIENGLKQIKKGEVIPQEEGLKKVRERYGLRK